MPVARFTFLSFLYNSTAGRCASEEMALELALLPAILHAESKGMTEDLPRSFVNSR